MGQISNCLRNVKDGYAHWCPGCEEMHLLPNSWNFNGNLENPTFTPSFKHFGVKRIFANGEWTGEWQLDANKNPINFTCHYFITNGMINYCSDCDHKLAGKLVSIPELPDYWKD